MLRVLVPRRPYCARPGRKAEAERFAAAPKSPAQVFTHVILGDCRLVRRQSRRQERWLAGRCMRVRACSTHIAHEPYRLEVEDMHVMRQPRHASLWIPVATKDINLAVHPHGAMIIRGRGESAKRRLQRPVEHPTTKMTAVPCAACLHLSTRYQRQFLSSLHPCPAGHPMHRRTADELGFLLSEEQRSRVKKRGNSLL